ncbi:amidohydrolase family protein [Bradyrhizobium manausense]|jgi:N-acetylglucosamine-6-phosphate deacetylase|uniref:N-acetylglucosamine-6-phosphate deacetylase n=1 Tax=Bradyrhizobium manausense TaxID=989370 RepID=UPI001BA9DD5B|nr:amidohydrolase family protein [Bradyrhizobium manausense]MBR0787796.1 amidohydrolase family protein [Bradyrhizobium manausense]
MPEPTTTRVVGRDVGNGQGVAVTIADGRIAAIEPTAPEPAAPYVAAGLIDLQVNGYGGLDFNDGMLTAERVSALTLMMTGLGVTTYLPTLITASRASLVSALSAIAAARRQDSLCARMIPFVHVEGPYLAPEDGPRGAHPREHVRAPDLDEVAEWQRVSGGLVGKITLSPHHDQVSSFIRAAVGQGILVAIGHTSATSDQIHEAALAGARLSTHLGNGASAMLPRHPNFIWAQLANERLDAGFIADGFHLPADTFKAMLRAKGLDRAYLVSDTAAVAGMPPGIYDQPIGGRVELASDGRLSVAGTPYLAGASRPLCQDVALAVRMADLTLADGMRLATINPGSFAGGRGRLAVGEVADLILFDWEQGAASLAIRETYVAGQRFVAQ